MNESWVLVRALMDGADAVRAGREKWLPKHPAETAGAYDVRLSAARLLNEFRNAVQDIGGRPFAEDVKLGENAPDEFKEWGEDIDLLGNNLHVFGQTLHEDAIAYGFGHFLVEMGEPSEAPRTLADQRQNRARPFFVRYRPENVLAMYGGIGADKKPRLTHLRLLESTVEAAKDDSFGEELVQRIRIYRLNDNGTVDVEVRVARSPITSGQTIATSGVTSGIGDWKVEAPRKVLEGLTRIPFVTVRHGDEVGGPLGYETRPPLKDLADLNIAHWQVFSDYRNVLTYSCFPMLQCKGDLPKTEKDETGATKPLEIGPHVVLQAMAGGGWEWVEPQGSGIQAAERALDRIEYLMRIVAMLPLVRMNRDVTASEAKGREKRAASPAQRWALATKDALEQGFAIMNEWLGGRTDPKTLAVSMNTDFGVDADDTAAINALLNLHGRGKLTDQTVREEFRRRGVLGNQFDEDEEVKALEAGGGMQLAQMPISQRGGSMLPTPAGRG